MCPSAQKSFQPHHGGYLPRNIGTRQSNPAGALFQVLLPYVIAEGSFLDCCGLGLKAEPDVGQLDDPPL